MKSVLQCSMLVLATLACGQLHAGEDEGGVGCLPGGHAAPHVPLGSAGSLLWRRWPAEPDPSGGNCNFVLVHSVPSGNIPGTNLEATPRDHTFAWNLLPDQAMRTRRLYIRANAEAALNSSEPLSVEIYRQILSSTDARNPEPMELRVLLVRMPPSHETLNEQLPGQTEVWVIAQNTHGRLGFLSTPINEANIAQCIRDDQQFAACVEIDASLNRLRLNLRSARGDQHMNLPAARVSQILLGNVAISAGQLPDVFVLAHSAHSESMTEQWSVRCA